MMHTLLPTTVATTSSTTCLLCSLVIFMDIHMYLHILYTTTTMATITIQADYVLSLYMCIYDVDNHSSFTLWKHLLSILLSSN